MKKRILSLALTLCLLAGLLPCLTVGAAAADRVDAAPYARAWNMRKTPT